ncbi:Ig-like domain-containing protein (plasmid) [Tundrisphaera lichenicola]|uniref:Ig-like domain-containing protein n=1 Tax=Tundrisphaera lichenicola TaxID=2029860 RepID=UPI003EBA7FB2
MIPTKSARRRHHASVRPVFDQLEIRQVLSTGDPTTLASSLGAPPAPGPNTIWVNSDATLQNAVGNLQSGQTIVIQKGTYNLSNTLYIGKNRAVTDVTIRGETDNFSDVVLLGKGMDNASFGGVASGISVYNAQRVTIADLSIGQVYYHPIELKGEFGASAVQIYHARLFDAGEQFIKGTLSASGVGVSNSSVQYTVMEYTAGTPKTDHGGGIGYTNGVDIHGGQNWIIRANMFRNFHVPDSASTSNWWNPAILMWNHSANTIAEGNTFINCDRAIAFGLYDNSGSDHQGGVIRNNFIFMQPGLMSATRKADSDAQVIVWDSPGTRVENNSILTNGNTAKSIEVRFTGTTNIPIVGNLTDAPLGSRNGATYAAANNYLTASADMFANPASGNLHLISNAKTQANVIDRIVASANVPMDWDGEARPVGGKADIGADEYLSTVRDTTPPAVTGRTPTPGATGVNAATAPTATFSEAVQAGTIAFTLKNASGAAVAAALSYDAATYTATLRPSANLAAGATYTATIAGAKDLAGNAMTSLSWSFTTAPATPSDTTPPTVTGRTPTPGATGVNAATAPTATFSEAVQAGTIAFTLKNASGAAVAAALSYDAATYTATLRPSANLAAGATYTATIAGAKDLAGNAMTSLSWSFTTAAAATPIGNGTGLAATYFDNQDFTGKVISRVDPTVNFNWGSGSPATGLGVDTFSARWTGQVQPLKSETYTFYTLSDDGVRLWVDGKLLINNWTNHGATENSGTIAMQAGQRYDIRMEYYEQGGSAVASLSWSSPTTPKAVVPASQLYPSDTTSPTVVAQNPGNSATNVPISVTAKATFNEAVQVSTISFTLKNAAGAAVAATLSYDAATYTAVLTPATPLASSTTYTATIAGAKDLAGNAMVTPVTETFTTAPATPSDTTPPTVTGRTPTPGATGVNAATAPTATFSEAVQAGTIAFTLKNASGAAVAAALSYDAATYTATLRPSANLAAGATYTATIAGAKDLAGNAMTSLSWSFTTAAAAATGLNQLPILDQSNLEYVGAFRVPTQQSGASSFQYGGSALAYNPANNSLFAVGNPQDQAVAEIAIPNSIVNSTNLGNLAVASVLQPFVKVLPKLPINPPEMSQGGMEAIGGLMVVNGQLVGTAFNTYDGTGSVMDSHFKLDSLNLSTARASGLYQVGNLGGGFVGGYMTQIPTEWQSTLGSSYLTGQAALSIISRSSYGPSAFGFDPNTLGSGVNPAIPYVYYDQYHQTLGTYDSNPPTLFNATVGGSDVTSLNAVFVPQTRSVLFFGSIGTGNYYYGEAADANDPNRPYKGVHSVGGNYTFQVWAYDALDFAAVKNGQKNPWDLKPYTTWQLNFPQPDGQKVLGGVAFDASTGRFYLSEMKADTSDLYANTPLIQVLQLKMPANPALSGAMSALDASATGPRVMAPIPAPVVSGGSIAPTALATLPATESPSVTGSESSKAGDLHTLQTSAWGKPIASHTAANLVAIVPNQVEVTPVLPDGWLGLSFGRRTHRR